MASGHRMDVLSIVSAVFGLLSVALAVYHWHLGRPRPRSAGSSRRPADAARALHEAAAKNVEARAAAPARPRQRSGIFPRAVLHADAPDHTGPTDVAHGPHEPALGLGQRGVYTTTEVAAARPEQRGQGAAERVLSDALGARKRRGRNAALDVIVVGASREGVAATLRLLAAGLRVLLVDAGSSDGLDAARVARDPSVRTALRALRRERLPIVWGHRMLGVATRPDGMLELSAERAAWYTANVIVAQPGGSHHERERAA